MAVQLFREKNIIYGDVQNSFVFLSGNEKKE